MNRQSLKGWQKIAYAAGSLGAALSYQAFNNRIQFLYIDEIGINAALIGTVWFIYGLWNAINDPLMGQLSDNTRSRFGRRIPYIAFATLPMVVFFILMWTPPRQVDTWLLVAYFILTVFIFDTLWTLVVIAWTALFPEMLPDLRERAAVSGWRQVFSILGLILALALTPIVIDQLGWTGMALTFGAVTAVSFFVSLLGSREQPELHQAEEGLPLFKALKASLTSRSFRWFLLANLAKEFIFNIMVAALPFYAKYVIRLTDIPGGLSAALQESLLLGVPFILSIPAMFVWTKITQRIGSRRAWIYASLAFIPGLIIVLVASNFTTAIIGTCTLVLGLPGLLMLSDLLISDVIDEDELIVGHRREGMFFGMNGAIIRLAFSAEAILIATILPLTGYIAPSEGVPVPVQPVSAVWGFRFLMAGAPILAVLVTVFALRFYPLYGKRLSEVRAQLDELHRQKEKQLSSAG
jgi:GPH family glycoside/pentoside/hexuronide:cation symporter